MSSTPMRTPTALRRVATVTSPRLKSSTPRMRKCCRPTWSMRSPVVRGLAKRGIGLVRLQLLAGDDDGADERGEQHQRGELEGEQPPGEEGVADGAGGGRERVGRALRPRGGDGHEGQHGGGGGEERQPARQPQAHVRDGHLRDPVRQHHGEEDEDEDAADVDEELRHREEVGREEDVERAGAGERAEEADGAVDDVLGEGGGARAGQRQRGEAVEEEVAERERPEREVALQKIAVCYLVAFHIYLWSGLRGVIVGIIGLNLLYLGLLYFYPVPVCGP